MTVVRALDLTVPGEPIPWARARSNGKRRFKAPKVVEYEQRVQAAWMEAGRQTLGTAPLGISAFFYPSRPASHLCKDGSLRGSAPLYPLRGDTDNFVKNLLDALSGCAYHDDIQVAEFANVIRHFAAPGDEPRTLLRLWALT